MLGGVHLGLGELGLGSNSTSNPLIPSQNFGPNMLHTQHESNHFDGKVCTFFFVL
jgi:hypothetical protein